MRKITIQAEKSDSNFSLSAEQWLSSEAADIIGEGIPLAELVLLHKKGTSTFDQSSLVLDTGHTDRGFITLPDRARQDSQPRTSHKKIVPEGAVVISRLRPYLKQVAFVPYGICSALKVNGILCSTEYYVLESKQALRSIAYLVPWLLSDEIQNVFVQATTGGHHPRFDDTLLMRLSVPDRIYSTSVEVSRKIEQLTFAHLDEQIQMGRLIAKI